METRTSHSPPAALASVPAEGQRTATSYRVIACVATALFCVISFVPRDGPENYRYAWLFLVPIIWATYLVRRRLDLLPSHFALLAAALVLHDLGAFGCYTESYLGLEFDYYVHFYFGLVGGLFVARALMLKFGLRGIALAGAVVLLVTGVGGIHEIIEAASTMVLGPERGMLKTDGNPTDTQEDLLNNVFGALTGFALWHVQRRFCKRNT